MLSQYAAIWAAIILVAVLVFQLLLAAGLPLGRAAWGGRHTTLPAKLRLGSLVAAIILAVAVSVVLTRAGWIEMSVDASVIRIATWGFAGFFLLNTLGNVASKSLLERNVMTPVTLVLALCFLTVALR